MEKQPSIEYTEKARHGHGNDVMDENNIRQVAGCLPIDPIRKRFLLISSSNKNNNHWVLPKGGWEDNESQAQAALRETWEEAGIKGRITRPLGVFEEVNKNQVKAHHWIYEMEINEVYKKFPEKKKRERRWYTYDEALIVVKAQYMKDAMMLSSLNPANQPRTSQQQHITTMIAPPSSVPVNNAPTSSPPSSQKKHLSLSHSLKTLFKKRSSL